MTTTLTSSPEQQTASHGQERQETLRRLDEMLGIADASPGQQPFYERATAQEWIAAFHLWLGSHDPDSPVLLDDSREAIYED